MANFKGVFPALLTPFTSDDKINHKAIYDVIKMNIDKGVNGFYVGGSTGEGLLLTMDERIELFEAAAEANNKKTTMIAHVGTINTAHAIKMAKAAERAGYDAISAVAPFYYGFTVDMIKKYYYEIADSVSIPMIMYNFPGASSFNLTNSVAEEIFENDKFIGIKHTTADLFQLQQFKTMSKNPIVYNGFDEMFVGGLSMGADGGIGSTYNFMAEKYIDIYNYFKSGDIKKAQEIQFNVNKIIAKLIKYGVFAMEKGVLTKMGIDMGVCRKPFLPLTQEGLAACDEIVEELKTF